MKKIKEFMGSIHIDKKDHYILGSLTAFLFIDFCIIFDLTQLISLALQVAVWGVYKELIHDKLQGKGTPETFDFLASMIPYTLILGTIYLMLKF